MFYDNKLKCFTMNKKVFFSLISRPEINFLVTWIGTRCTLRCKRCCNQIPFLAKRSFDIEETIADLDFIRSLSTVKKLQVQGGEPLTHPRFDIMLKYLLVHPEQRADIATNGTLKFSEKALALAKEHAKSFEKAGHLRIRISNYAIENIKHPLAIQLSENGIHCNSYEFMFGNGQWFDTGNPLCTRSSYESCVQNYLKCPNKDCVTLVDGVIYVCGKVAAVRELHVDAEKVPKNYSKKSFPRGLQINVRKIRTSRWLKFLGLRKLVGRYCINRFNSLVEEARPECAFCRINSNLYPAAEQISSMEINSVIKKVNHQNINK